MNSVFSYTLEWLLHNKLESFASLLGIINIYFGIKEKPIFWFFGIINAIMFFVLYFQNKLYAYMMLQTYYMGLGVYGLYYWIKGGKKENNKKVVVNRAGIKKGIIIFLAFLMVFFAVYMLLKNYTDSVVPIMDSLSASSAIIAAYMMVKKHIECWFVWFASDIVAVSLLFYKALYAALALQILYFAFTIIGYIEWRKSMLKSTKKSANS